MKFVHFYIGDDEDKLLVQHGDVRAVIFETSDEGDLQCILLASD